MISTSKRLLAPSLASLLVLASCGGGGGSNSNTNTNQAGAVVVAVDTRAGGEELVQIQLAGVTLEGPAGIQTGNLLDEVQSLVIADAVGEVAGVRLMPAPAQEYAAVHLIVVPGSGIALDASGTVQPVDVPMDIRIPIPGGLQHRADGSSWLVVGHDAEPLVTAAGSGALSLQPQMSARGDGEELRLERLAYPVVDGGSVRVTATTVGGSVLTVTPRAGCVFTDDQGNTYPDWQSFAAELQPEEELDIRGDFDRDSDVLADDICKCTDGSESRLIGRVQSVDPAVESFVLRVQAVNRRSSGLELVTPEDIIVLAAYAQIERPNGAALDFSALAPGQLAKVRWESRLIEPGEVTRYGATNVQVPGPGGAGMSPQWQGNVQSVDPVAGVVVLTPRNGAGIRVNGQLLQQLEVRVDTGTTILRIGQGAPSTIPLNELQAGGDRCWVRGTVVEPGVVEASRLRVKSN